MNEQDRRKLITEMVRVSDLIYQIEALPVADFFSAADDYSQEFESKSNLKEVKYNFKNNLLYYKVFQVLR